MESENTKTKISIVHYSDENFHDEFRSDLVCSQESVVIYSPFLSQNRAIHYYPVLRGLTLRSVAVQVYSKPQSEQPEMLHAQFKVIERTLKMIGVRFHVRPSMHEKLAIIDEKILWHGSLNILSHADTKESMFRFDYPELVQEIMTDFDLSSKPHSESDTEETEIISGETEQMPSMPYSCPACSGPMHLYEKIGLWICDKSPVCGGTITSSEDASSIRNEQSYKDEAHLIINLSCPLCGADMELKQGLFIIASCTSKACGFSLDPRLSASLARILRRKS